MTDKVPHVTSQTMCDQCAIRHDAPGAAQLNTVLA
jgi:hypothetical protein